MYFSCAHLPMYHHVNGTQTMPFSNLHQTKNNCQGYSSQEENASESIGSEKSGKKTYGHSYYQ